MPHTRKRDARIARMKLPQLRANGRGHGQLCEGEPTWKRYRRTPRQTRTTRREPRTARRAPALGYSEPACEAAEVIDLLGVTDDGRRAARLAPFY
jgi:hypothetical protein